jgi:hypothetical protein
MKSSVQQFGIDRGRALIRETIKENGTPESGVTCSGCNNAPAVITDSSGEPECAECMFLDLRECEERWGTVSEFATTPIYWGEGLAQYRERPRYDRALMFGVFGGIFLELAEIKTGK